MTEESSVSIKKNKVVDILSTITSVGANVHVSLSHEIITLLSEQMYQSPLKAIEELVVNSYDANATECRIHVPPVAVFDPSTSFIVVYDNGFGMSLDGLVDLWQIGRSTKRPKEEQLQRLKSRKLIGKFGIGKLATYSIANQITYITKTTDDSGNSQILSVSVDFKDFSSSPTGAVLTKDLPVREIRDWNVFSNNEQINLIYSSLNLSTSELNDAKSWTFVILEELKPGKFLKIKMASLNWVLSTAMPIKSNFKIFLNTNEILSSKESYEKLVGFDVTDINPERLVDLSKSTGEIWSIKDSKLISPSFPSGITGTIIVTKNSLYGKSNDIARSHGFFIRVRDRLINDDDPLFGMKPLFYGVFNRFRAEIEADDLDKFLKASRETIEDSDLKDKFRLLLREIFNETNSRYTKWENSQRARKPKERDVEHVPPSLVAYPIADSLLSYKADPEGPEADDSWFYIKISPESDIPKIVKELYTEKRKYHYNYSQKGSSSRMVNFDPLTSTFWLNEDHELIKEYGSEGRTQQLLEDLATAEAMLEVYLRENHIPKYIISEILEQRDTLFRSLVKDHVFSPKMVAKNLRDASDNDNDLEIALVVAARSLGFVATHVSGSGEPDGLAKFFDYPSGPKLITLEAKASKTQPELSNLDFAGLREHMTRTKAAGCLLIAPSYPGGTREENSAVSFRGREQGVSCWTIEQLAQFVEKAESRQLKALDLLNIVLNAFSPEEVTNAINKLFEVSTRDNQALYRAILKALKNVSGRLVDRPRTIDMVAIKVTDDPDFADVEWIIIEQAIYDLEKASQGSMTIRDKNIILHVSIDELERRLVSLTKLTGEPKSQSGFRNYV